MIETRIDELLLCALPIHVTCIIYGDTYQSGMSSYATNVEQTRNIPAVKEERHHLVETISASDLGFVILQVVKAHVTHF